MNRVWRRLGAVSLAASMAAVVAAQAPALDVKMGLWEMTSVTAIGGEMPGYDTSKMTPEQKAKIEEAMKAMMGSHTNVTKSCLTKEKFEKSIFMMDNERGRNCTQKITTNTRTTLDGTLSCTGDNAITGEMHIDALSPTAIKGVIKSTASEKGRTMNVNVTMTGKWLGADCGSEK